MASAIETGHAKVMANFDQLVTSVKGIGTDYNPSNPTLTIESLQKTSSGCKEAMNAVGNALLTFRTTIKARESAFAQLSQLSTRILNSLKASDTSGKSDEIAKSYVRKIHGRRAKAKRTEDEKKADAEAGIQYKEISASQMSFDMRLENFRMIVELISVIPAYQPNEKDLKTETLKLLAEELSSKNESVRSASANLFKARALRNEIMYKEATGLVDIALDAKTYLKAAFGSSSYQYKEVAGLLFKRLSKN